MGAAGLSYASVACLEQNYGPIRLVGLHGFIPNNFLGPEYSIFARLLFDQLWLDIFYMEEDMDRQTAQTIADEIHHFTKRLRTSEFAEAVTAFFEKRKPKSKDQ